MWSLGAKVFQKSVGIPMGTSGALLLAILFLYSYEVDFAHKLVQN
jgi:hypothetical protein